MQNISQEELSKHNSEASCWIAIEGKVYDVTSFLNDHPGGKKIVLAQAGKDASKAFKMMHNETVLPTYGPKYLIGVLATTSSSTSAPVAASSKGLQPSVDLSLSPSSSQSWSSGGTADELPRERAKASFDVETLTNVFDGGVEGTKRRRWILAPLKTIETHLKHEMSREDLISKHVDDFITIHKGFIEEGYLPQGMDIPWMSAHAVNTGPLMPHMSLFLATLRGQASMEQQMWWLPRALTFKIIGSYAQTELGHGSNVRGLQTTAHYDKATQEFVLNTPTLQSMKWWNSNIGVTATHAVVYAQLILDNKEFGVHVFFVHLRDEEHRLLEGIEAGDVGAKLGDHAIDTGYLRLKNVRIPREHLLAKRAHITPDGRYIRHKSEEGPGSEKLHYLTMLIARSGMIFISGVKLSIAVTVAARYSCVRRQGFIEGSENSSFNSTERQVIDYTVQLYRILKQLSIAVAIRQTGMWVAATSDTNAAVLAKDAPKDGVVIDISEVHASSAGLKGLCTQLAADGIEDCRKACGGHGYLLNSGVAALAADYVWQTTAEGDFIVMLLQTGRFLVKCVSMAREGQSLPGLTAYLAPLKSASYRPSVPRAKNVTEFSSLPHLRSLFELRALFDSTEAADAVNKHLSAGASQANALNAAAAQLVRAARSHSMFFMLDKFLELVHNTTEPTVNAVLSRLCTMFACQEISDGSRWNGLLDQSQSRLNDEAIQKLLSQLRPDVVAIVDAFDIPDNVLNSTLGRKDGNVYEALYAGALRSELNREQPFRGYKFLRPHLDLEFLKLRNQPLPEVLEERQAKQEVRSKL